MLQEAQELAQRENRTMSELVREALRQYQKQKRWDAISAYGRASADAIGVRDEEDVVRVIHEFRNENRKPKKPQKPVR